MSNKVSGSNTDQVSINENNERRCNFLIQRYKLGRKSLATLVSVVIVIISVAYCSLSVVYYSSPPTYVSGNLFNSLKEILLLVVSLLLLASEIVQITHHAFGALLDNKRAIVSMAIAAVNAVLHFGVLMRWYVQEGSVYGETSAEEYVLMGEVRAIMILVLVDFMLCFTVFSLLLLTKMRPKFKDLNPHLTASMLAQNQSDI